MGLQVWQGLQRKEARGLSPVWRDVQRGVKAAGLPVTVRKTCLPRWSMAGICELDGYTVFYSNIKHPLKQLCLNCTSSVAYADILLGVWSFDTC